MKLYVLADQKLSKEQQFVQGTHAALEWALGESSPDHPVLVMLSCPDIKEFASKLMEENKKFYEFRDTYYDRKLTAIASMEIGDLVKDFELI